MNIPNPQSSPTMPSRPKFEFASVPWYTESTYYEQFRAAAIDSDSFFYSFQEWLAAALEHERQAQRHGVTIVRVRMFPKAFKQWCESSGARNDAAGRSAYAEDRAERLYAVLAGSVLGHQSGHATFDFFWTDGKLSVPELR